jgi:hypothetical protein
VDSRRGTLRVELDGYAEANAEAEATVRRGDEPVELRRVNARSRVVETRRSEAVNPSAAAVVDVHVRRRVDVADDTGECGRGVVRLRGGEVAGPREQGGSGG